MQIWAHGVSQNADSLMRDIETYDLFRHVVELEAYGVTVVPPQGSRSEPGFIDRLRAAIIRVCEKRCGILFSDYEAQTPPAAKMTRTATAGTCSKKTRCSLRPRSIR